MASDSGRQTRPIRRGFCALALLACVITATTAAAGAQGLVNPALARAESLAMRGDSAGSRILVDSILADTDPTATIYPAALYWRGALASNPTDARKDLLRLIVDYPFSGRTGDALFLLAQSEVATGDQSNARRHLARLARDHAGSQYGFAGAFQLGKMLMADGEVLEACAALDSALAHVPAESIETRNQISYIRRPCDRAVASASRAAADSGAARRNTDSSSGIGGRGTAGRAARPGTSRPSMNTTRADSTAARRQAAPTGRWSVQVAAFAERADATAMVARLKSRGYDARVVDLRPYRVRIGRFTNRVEATELAAKLKAEGTTAIIVEAERP